jgi:transposase-like protein
MKTKVQNRSTKNDEIIKAIPAACADEQTAVEFFEKQRWGASPACPCCGSVAVYQMKDSKTGERQANNRWRCKDCKKQYTVRTGTVFEDSRIELRHWCFAFWRASTSKKGVSALEIHRQTGISYKSCLFMLNRIRFAMSDSAPEILGPDRGIVEVDETYVGGKPRHPNYHAKAFFTQEDHRKTWHKKKQAVLAMVERGGKVKTKPIANVTGSNVQSIMRENIDKSARIATDQSVAYPGCEQHFTSGHRSVNHSKKEYVRGEIHTNTVEGFFSSVKRGLHGIYHSVSKEHLHRYMSEFEFRYNHRHIEDGPRTLQAIKGAEGKRLTYKETQV